MNFPAGSLGLLRSSDSLRFKSEALQSSKGIPDAMTSACPAKSQPLHNFNLPHLKWNKEGQSNAHPHRRRSVKSPPRKRSTSSASPVRQLPLHDTVSPSTKRHQSPMADYAAAAAAASRLESPVQFDYLRKHSPAIGNSSKPHRIRESATHTAAGTDRTRHFPRRDLSFESGALIRFKDSSIDCRKSNSKNSALDIARNRVSSTHPARALQKIVSKIGKAPSQRETQSIRKGKDVGVAGAKRSKILIKLPQQDSKIEIEEEKPKEDQPKIDKKDEDGESDEAQEGCKGKCIDDETKIWNLRPRKPIRRLLNVNGGTVNSSGLLMPPKNRAQSPSRNFKSGENGSNNVGGGEKKEKRKLNISVALSKEEIEEDIFALTGSKPARRPKKKPKNIQKQLDSVFPGLWLVSITEDSYKVPESFMKA